MRDRDKLNAEVLQDLADRSVWDTRQRMFYEMRHHGLRRKNKPWPGASDVHFPLVDTTISELKPAYFQQLFATDLIAPGEANDKPRNRGAEFGRFDADVRHRYSESFVGLFLEAPEVLHCRPATFRGTRLDEGHSRRGSDLSHLRLLG